VIHFRYEIKGGLERNKEVSMKVKKIMNKQLVSLPVEATIHDAAIKMRENGVGSVLIMAEGGKLEGILTDRDVALAVAADCKDPKTSCAYDIMVTEPITIQSNADLEAALRVMNTTNVRRLPVCENGKVIGLVSSADIAVEIREEINQFMGLEEAFAKHA
jgi:CBS domain-containing protein